MRIANNEFDLIRTDGEKLHVRLEKNQTMPRTEGPQTASDQEPASLCVVYLSESWIDDHECDESHQCAQQVVNAVLNAARGPLAQGQEDKLTDSIYEWLHGQRSGGALRDHQ